jgi:hypothetical protein
MRFVRTVLAALVFSALGAAAGRFVAQWRREQAAGLAPQVDLASAQPRPRDLVPGLIAALRVRDRPWSYLHVPSWLAAFTVNFAVAALARELGPLLRALGIHGEDAEAEPATQWGATQSEVWTAEVPTSGPTEEPPSTTGFRPFPG